MSLILVQQSWCGRYAALVRYSDIVYQRIWRIVLEALDQGNAMLDRNSLQSVEFFVQINAYFHILQSAPVVGSSNECLIMDGN